jgi:hypothetical protein
MRNFSQGFRRVNPKISAGNSRVPSAAKQPMHAAIAEHVLALRDNVLALQTDIANSVAGALKTEGNSR